MSYFATGFVKEWDVDAMGTHRLTEAEARLMAECDELWMGRRFWKGSIDAGAAQDAVAFAYMMADKQAPGPLRRWTQSRCAFTCPA